MISLVVPVYNEGDNIPKLLQEIHTKVTVEFEVVVVYDFDEDNTVPVVKQIAPQYPFTIRLVKNSLGRGALNAIKTGFRETATEAVLVVMADLSDDLIVVNAMYDKIKAGYDVVCGSRYMRGGKQLGGPLLKKTISRVAGVSLHYLARIPTHDVTNSFKMYSRRVLDTIVIESDGGFEIGMELTVKAYLKGYLVTEVPSVWFDRAAGESRFRMWQWMPKYLKWYRTGILGVWLGRKAGLHENNQTGSRHLN